MTRTAKVPVTQRRELQLTDFPKIYTSIISHSCLKNPQKRQLQKWPFEENSSFQKWPNHHGIVFGPGFFSTSRVFFSTSCLFFNLRCLFFNLRGSVFISTSFFLFFQPHMSFFGPHISSHVFFSTSHIFFSTSHVFLSTLYVSLSTCNVSFPSPLDWFLFGMLIVLWVNVGFLWSAF